MLSVGLVSRVDVIILFCANWLPLVRADETIIEDLLSVDINKATITIVSNTTTIVTLSNQVLNSLPWHFTLLEVLIRNISDAAHIVSNGILANLIVTIVE